MGEDELVKIGGRQKSNEEAVTNWHHGFGEGTDHVASVLYSITA